MHTYMHTTQLVHTQLTRTYSSTHHLLHTNPSPPLFPFLLSPCHLYLSFAPCWKKLTCGVIRSFNYFFAGQDPSKGGALPSIWLSPWFGAGKTGVETLGFCRGKSKTCPKVQTLNPDPDPIQVYPIDPGSNI